MKITILDNVRTRFINILSSIGNYLSREVTEKRQKYFPQLHTKFVKQHPPKQIYGHKGSGYKGKGSINTDAATFNQPRKDVGAGRSH
jgi:hypothetical protein